MWESVANLIYPSISGIVMLVDHVELIGCNVKILIGLGEMWSEVMPLFKEGKHMTVLI